MVKKNDYLEVYDSFWKGICEKNGSVDMDQVKRELFDFHKLMDTAGKVFDEVTGGRRTKLTYEAAVYIAEFNHYVQGLIQEAIEDYRNNRGNYIEDKKWGSLSERAKNFLKKSGYKNFAEAKEAFKQGEITETKIKYAANCGIKTRRELMAVFE